MNGLTTSATTTTKRSRRHNNCSTYTISSRWVGCEHFFFFFFSSLDSLAFDFFQYIDIYHLNTANRLLYLLISSPENFVLFETNHYLIVTLTFDGNFGIHKKGIEKKKKRNELKERKILLQ